MVISPIEPPSSTTFNRDIEPQGQGQRGLLPSLDRHSALGKQPHTKARRSSQSQLRTCHLRHPASFAVILRAITGLFLFDALLLSIAYFFSINVPVLKGSKVGL